MDPDNGSNEMRSFNNEKIKTPISLTIGLGPKNIHIFLIQKFLYHFWSWLSMMWRNKLILSDANTGHAMPRHVTIRWMWTEHVVNDEQVSSSGFKPLYLTGGHWLPYKGCDVVMTTFLPLPFALSKRSGVQTLRLTKKIPTYICFTHTSFPIKSSFNALFA